MLRHAVLLSLVPFLSFSFPLSLSLSPTVANKRQEVQATKQMRLHNNSNPSQVFWDPRQPNEELERDEDADKQGQIRGNNNNKNNN
jgi:hypothetical protein